MLPPQSRSFFNAQAEIEAGIEQMLSDAVEGSRDVPPRVEREEPPAEGPRSATAASSEWSLVATGRSSRTARETSRETSCGAAAPPLPRRRESRA